LFLYIFAIGCPSGESYEMEFPEDASIKPPGSYYTSLEACFFDPQNIFTPVKQTHAIVF
jgi:hypothetical protein